MPDREPHQNSYVFLLPHWNDETTKDLLVEGWEQHVSQPFINERCQSMPAYGHRQ